jgi:hypothetical protein
VPYKVNAEKRQSAPRAKRRVTNWREYDRSLRQRGSLTVWFTEAQMGRYKTVIGEALRFFDGQAQATEIAIAVDVLNRMIDLGRPESVRVA